MEKMLFNFGCAIKGLKGGSKLARKGWNGKDMWLIYVAAIHGVHPKLETPYYGAGMKGPITIDPHIDMVTVRGTVQPGWQPTQSDLLAEDWHIV